MDFKKYLIPVSGDIANEGLFSGLFSKNKSSNILPQHDGEMKTIAWIRKNWAKIVKESSGPEAWVVNPQNPDPEMLWVEDIARRLKQSAWDLGMNFIYLTMVEKDNKNPMVIGFIIESLNKPGKDLAAGTVVVEFSKPLQDIMDHKVSGFDAHLWFHSYWSLRDPNKLPSNTKAFDATYITGLHFGK